MCKTSKEIQTQWIQTPGDFYVGFCGNVLCWTFNNTKSTKIKHGFKVENNVPLVRIEKLFWLPRLNQLVEIAQSKNNAFSNISYDFLEWIKEPYNNENISSEMVFNSLEQMWLAYIMKKKFSKKWENEAWVNC